MDQKCGDCALHAHSICLQNGVENAFRVGGLGNVTILQYYLGSHEFVTDGIKINPHCDADTMQTLQRPVLTWWEYVNHTAEMVLASFNE